MRALKSIVVGMSLLVLSGIAKGRITCETQQHHQIGWCMNPDNEQDREDCPIEYFDCDTPEDGDCPDEDVWNPPELITDGL